MAAALLVIGVVYGRAADRTDRTPVPSFDLARYMGTWYEIARYDHPFERGLAGVQARYELRPDGRIGVFNSGTDYRSGRCKRARGKACAGQVPGRLRVSFFWVFYSTTSWSWRSDYRLGIGFAAFAVLPSGTGHARRHSPRLVAAQSASQATELTRLPDGQASVRRPGAMTLRRRGAPPFPAHPCHIVINQSSPWLSASNRNPSHSNSLSISGSVIRFLIRWRVISPRHIFV